MGLAFPSGPLVKNPLCNAEDTGSVPGVGQSAVGQLSPHATATEVKAPQSSCSTTREATTTRSQCALQLESSPRLLQLEKGRHAATKTQCSQDK